MYPIRFQPIEKTSVWGTESWEIADRPEGATVVVNGPWQGKTLSDLMLEFGEILLGYPHSSFPLLIKRIYAKENLSVQVHPRETTGSEEAKSEAWVTLQKGTIYAGLKKGDLNGFRESIHKGTVEQVIEQHLLEAGEAIYIPGGSIHAIGANSSLLEVQQNSNTTYRLYDWGRVGRELHLEKGFIAMRQEVMKKAVPVRIDSYRERLIEAPYFQIDRVQIGDRYELICSSFQIIFCLKGEGVVEIGEFAERLEPEGFYFISANAHATVRGSSELLVIIPGYTV